MVIKLAISIIALTLAVYSAIHALLYKKDSRAAFGWIAVSFLLPIFGPILYFIFGVNRVHARAQKLSRFSKITKYEYEDVITYRSVKKYIPESLSNLFNVSNKITNLSICHADDLTIFDAGEDAYTSMLCAINNAKNYIYLCTYIFKADKIGQKFVESLIDANNRGVDVYVLIDGLGEYYSWKKVFKYFKKNNINFHRFLPPKLIPFNIYINLRNHRKLLIVDDEISFVGGMNISGEYYEKKDATHQPLKDIHFRISGNISVQLKQIFENDWKFAGGNDIDTREIKHEMTTEGILCRAIMDGPGENLDHLSIILLSAINTAEKNIIIMSPYFLPSREIVAALQIASLRGVNISIILPERNNLVYVDWAMRHMLWQLLEKDINIYYQPKPFSHAKMFTVDDQYCLIGSANIDPRSLRLNYEICVEIYNKIITYELNLYAQKILPVCRNVTLEELDTRPLHLKLRDGIAWLFSPYL